MISVLFDCAADATPISVLTATKRGLPTLSRNGYGAEKCRSATIATNISIVRENAIISCVVSIMVPCLDKPRHESYPIPVYAMYDPVTQLSYYHALASPFMRGERPPRTTCTRGAAPASKIQNTVFVDKIEVWMDRLTSLKCRVMCPPSSKLRWFCIPG